MANRIEEIFNLCLQRIERGDSIEHCLEDFPESAAELDILLRTSLNISWRSSLVEPRPEFKRRARAEFVRMLASRGLDSHYAAMEKRYRKNPFLGLQRTLAPVLATLAVILLLGSAGGVTAAVAGSAMPDQPLYPVKLFTEEARLAFSFTDAEKALVNMQIAEARSNEIQVMASEGKTQQVILTTQRLMVSIENADEAINRVLQSQSGSTMLAAVPPGTQKEPGSTVIPPATDQSPDTYATQTTSDDPNRTDAAGSAAQPERSRLPENKQLTPAGTEASPDAPLTPEANKDEMSSSKSAKFKYSIQSSIDHNITTLETALEKADKADKNARSSIEQAIEKSKKQRQWVDEELPNNGNNKGSSTTKSGKQ